MRTATTKAIDLARLEHENATELASMVRELEGSGVSDAKFNERFVANGGKSRDRRFATRFVARDGKFKRAGSGV